MIYDQIITLSLAPSRRSTSVHCSLAISNDIYLHCPWQIWSINENKTIWLDLDKLLHLIHHLTWVYWFGIRTSSKYFRLIISKLLEQEIIYHLLSCYIHKIIFRINDLKAIHMYGLCLLLLVISTSATKPNKTYLWEKNTNECLIFWFLLTFIIKSNIMPNSLTISQSIYTTNMHQIKPRLGFHILFSRELYIFCFSHFVPVLINNRRLLQFW